LSCFIVESTRHDKKKEVGEEAFPHMVASCRAVFGEPVALLPLPLSARVLIAVRDEDLIQIEREKRERERERKRERERERERELESAGSDGVASRQSATAALTRCHPNCVLTGP
jgi:hypothetical protein